MPKHLKDDRPTRPNTLLDVGASPVPEGVELRTVVRLEDGAYTVAKVFTTEQLEYILDGLQLALDTAKYKQRPVPSAQPKQSQQPQQPPSPQPQPSKMPVPMPPHGVPPQDPTRQ